MTAKAAIHDTERKEGVIVSLPVKGSAAKIYKGAPIFVDSTGYAFANDGTTNALAVGDVFMGIADDTVDNSAGSDGDLEVPVYLEGIVEMPCTVTANAASVGKEAYVNDTTDDAGITTTSATTGNPQVGIGRVVEFIDASTVRVKLTACGTAVANVA